VAPVSLLPHLRNARDLADRDYRAPLDLDALAGAPHVSKYHFARCFTETYGETPMRYLARRRIERAQDLLRSANLNVTEVCMMVGFTSLGSFSSRFRELVGESPTQYRDRWAARGGPHIPGCFLFMRGIDGWADGRQAQDSNLGEASAPDVRCRCSPSTSTRPSLHGGYPAAVVATTIRRTHPPGCAGCASAARSGRA
jgi:AraC-like DNA-binding protein